MSQLATNLRPLGKNGPKVAPMGLGLMGLSTSYYGETPKDEERFTVLDRALEIGESFWDTSDMYGDNEDFIGAWFKKTGKRAEIFLASKFGIIFKDGEYTFDSSAAYCKQACAQSLKRLGVESIDLYYVHHVNHDVPVEETMRAMAELQKEGKIKHIGLSNISSNTLRRAYAIAPVAAVQVEYSPYLLDIENSNGTNLLATCRELGVAVVAYSPLGRGLVTSTFSEGQAQGEGYTTREASIPRFASEHREANMECVRQFGALAKEKGCTTSQLALAWLLKQGDDIFPNPGTKKIKYLEENWSARLIAISDEEQRLIRELVEKVPLLGKAAPEKFETLRWLDTKAE